jgi:hypothetical protein
MERQLINTPPPPSIHSGLTVMYMFKGARLLGWINQGAILPVYPCPTQADTYGAFACASGRADPVSPPEMAGPSEQYHVGIVSWAFPQKMVGVKPALGSDFHPMAPHLSHSGEDPYGAHSHRSPHNILTASHSHTSCSKISLQCSFNSLYWPKPASTYVTRCLSSSTAKDDERTRKERLKGYPQSEGEVKRIVRGPGTSTEAKVCTIRKPKYIRGSGVL